MMAVYPQGHTVLAYIGIYGIMEAVEGSRDVARAKRKDNEYANHNRCHRGRDGVWLLGHRSGSRTAVDEERDCPEETDSRHQRCHGIAAAQIGIVSDSARRAKQEGMRGCV